MEYIKCLLSEETESKVWHLKKSNLPALPLSLTNWTGPGATGMECITGRRIIVLLDSIFASNTNQMTELGMELFEVEILKILTDYIQMKNRVQSWLQVQVNFALKRLVFKEYGLK